MTRSVDDAFLDEGLQPVSVEVLVGGNPPAAKVPCGHRSFSVQPVVANLANDGGAIVAHRVQVKVRCAECGTPGRFDVAGAIVSGDGLTAGIPFSPVEEDA